MLTCEWAFPFAAMESLGLDLYRSVHPTASLGLGCLPPPDDGLFDEKEHLALWSVTLANGPGRIQSEKGQDQGAC